MAVALVGTLLAFNARPALAGTSDDPSGPVSADRSSVVVANAQQHSGRSVAQPLVPTHRGRTALVTDQVKAGIQMGSELPWRSNGPIVSTSGVPGAPAQRVTLGFPREISGSREAQVAANGTVVYADPAGIVDVAAQTDRNGSVRIHTILRNADAPKAYTYPLSLPAGASAALNKDGSVRVKYRGSRTDARTGHRESVAVGIGGVAPAWAVDANGVRVPTRYEMDGKNLRQVVDTSHVVAWPVTADPTFWWGSSLTLSNVNSLKLIAALGVAAGVTGILILLGSASVVGIPAATLFTIATGLLVIGAGAVAFCAADGTGVVINKSWASALPWCHSA